MPVPSPPTKASTQYTLHRVGVGGPVALPNCIKEASDAGAYPAGTVRNTMESSFFFFFQIRYDSQTNQEPVTSNVFKEGTKKANSILFHFLNS